MNFNTKTWCSVTIFRLENKFLNYLFFFFIFYFEMNFARAERHYLIIVSKKEYGIFLMIIWILKLFEVWIWYFFNVKSEFKFENWVLCCFILLFNIVLSCHYLSNELTVETDVLNFHLRHCLHKSRDGITNRTGQ